MPFFRAFFPHSIQALYVCSIVVGFYVVAFHTTHQMKMVRMQWLHLRNEKKKEKKKKKRKKIQTNQQWNNKHHLARSFLHFHLFICFIYQKWIFFYERRVRMPLCVDSKSLSKRVADDVNNNNVLQSATIYMWTVHCGQNIYSGWISKLNQQWW